MNRLAYPLLTASVLALTVCAVAKEKKIDRAALPPAVEKTVQAQSQDATIKGFTTEVENGKRVYEAEMMVNGHSRDIEIAPDGSLNEVEEEVAFDSVPANVQATLTAKAKGAKITKVESLKKQDKLVAYEAATLKGTKRGEIQVGPNGQTLSHEE
ncbi:MAG TPA: PepSY-like domain-containing protein [Edaphobacter sp.]|nr:PepSY-like domain-containing protein [Edaphobacter sp.]